MKIPKRRIVVLALLVLYASALFVGALPRPVRPRGLDFPNALVNLLLRDVAIRPGISVFHPPRERIVDVLRNDCIRVRGLRAGAAPEVLAPPDGRCMTSGVRIGVPPLEWMLRSVLTGGEASLLEIEREATIGDFFCFAPPWRERHFDQIELVWTQPSFQIDTGAEKTTNLLFFRWHCAPPGVDAEGRGLSDDALRRATDGA